MARFLDRIVAAGGARIPFSLDYMGDTGRGPSRFLAETMRMLPGFDDELRRARVDPDDPTAVSSLVHTIEMRAVGTQRWEAGSADPLRSLPVFAGDWVPEWVNGIEPGRGPVDFAGPLLAPFPEFWVEMQTGGRQFRDLQRYFAWGAHIEEIPRIEAKARLAMFNESGFAPESRSYELDAVTPYRAQIYVEPIKGDPVGPIGDTMFLVDEAGDLVVTHEPDICFIHFHIGRHVLIPPDFRSGPVDMLITPIVTTWGLINLDRGIEIHERSPAKKLSDKHEKRTGSPLVTYREIAIGADVRRVVDEAVASGRSLAQALHYVRGSTATYTEERPLFGRRGDPRFVGKIRRPGHLRGDPAHGVVEKTYVADPDAVRPRPNGPNGPDGIGS